MNNFEFCRAPVWYPALSGHTFLTSFVKLQQDEIQLLAEGKAEGKAVAEVISRMRQPMNAIPGNCFVSVDTVSPTDTERFKNKRGAVFSPGSAWYFLAKSAKVRHAAANGLVEYISLKPFRRINQPREFRLFIYQGQLVAMSQYWLIRHFRRLEGIKEKLWKKAEKFYSKIAWAIPIENLVMDIYLTSDDTILVIDLNPWGNPTDPLLLRNWDRPWQNKPGIVLMPPPWKISGEVNVSF